MIKKYKFNTYLRTKKHKISSNLKIKSLTINCNILGAKSGISIIQVLVHWLGVNLGTKCFFLMILLSVMYVRVKFRENLLYGP